jgi:hypothetical protein
MDRLTYERWLHGCQDTASQGAERICHGEDDVLAEWVIDTILAGRCPWPERESCDECTHKTLCKDHGGYHGSE